MASLYLNSSPASGYEQPKPLCFINLIDFCIYTRICLCKERKHEHNKTATCWINTYWHLRQHLTVATEFETCRLCVRLCVSVCVRLYSGGDIKTQLLSSGYCQSNQLLLENCTVMLIYDSTPWTLLPQTITFPQIALLCYQAKSSILNLRRPFKFFLKIYRYICTLL